MCNRPFHWRRLAQLLHIVTDLSLQNVQWDFANIVEVQLVIIILSPACMALCAASKFPRSTTPSLQRNTPVHIPNEHRTDAKKDGKRRCC